MNPNVVEGVVSKSHRDNTSSVLETMRELGADEQQLDFVRSLHPAQVEQSDRQSRSESNGS
jgi:hypothetical protein